MSDVFADVGQPAAAKPLSPKRPPTETAGFADVFPYYAGFSFDWAQEQIRKATVESDVVLDPWNGSGTTTLAAQYAARKSVGIDLNPVANLVARFRSLAAATSQCEILKSPFMLTGRGAATDPLDAWFSATTSNRIRDWFEAMDGISTPQTALVAITLFRVVRELTKSFEGSNPTWVKRARSEEERIEVSPDELDKIILFEQGKLIERLADAPSIDMQPKLLTATANDIPMRNSSVDLVITSPPYLTRIDYAVAYARELAVLGVDLSKDRTLRSQLMGTTLIRSGPNVSEKRLGPTAKALLSSISGHTSKASSGYYLKQAQQYLYDLSCGLTEISRVVKPSGRLLLVVQDSYYKDIHVALGDICIDELTSRGWQLEHRKPFPVKRILTSLNSSARAYQKGTVCENVMTFVKQAES
ncbi:DNA methyltransferase [Nonomuraea sp. B12E4]|uniref:DNA methyltransferase n=1 Tax=Nonomuraea sp. B12E4 TaxID=3153564 RepID=UPI00325CD9C7